MSFGDSFFTRLFAECIFVFCGEVEVLLKTYYIFLHCMLKKAVMRVGFC